MYKIDPNSIDSIADVDVVDDNDGDGWFLFWPKFEYFCITYIIHTHTHSHL